MASAMAPRDSPGAAAPCNLVVNRDRAAYGSPRSPYIARSTRRWRAVRSGSTSAATTPVAMTLVIPDPSWLPSAHTTAAYSPITPAVRPTYTSDRLRTTSMS